MSDPHTTCTRGWRNCTNCYEVCTEASPCTCCLLARDTRHRYWQEREKTRCKSDMAYHCATHDTQWLDDESDRCEYKRMVDAEAAIQRVRKLHHPIPGFNDSLWCGAHCESTADGDPTEYPCETIRALEGDSDD